MSNKRSRKGVAYIRYSSAHQNIESAEAQLRAIEKYAKENNINIVNVYQDLGETGTKVTKRVQFKKMIKDSELGLFEIVLCHKIDRFARNTMDFLNYEKELNNNGVDLIAVEQPFGDSPAEKVARTLMISMAQMFSENLSSEVKYKMQEYARKGQYCGGTTPFGYKIENKRYVINEAEAITVRRIFELYAMGYGLSKISRILNTEGHTTRDGQSFIPNTLKRMIKNPIHKGQYTYNKFESKKYRKKDADNIIVVEDNHPAIVSKDLWKAANDRLSKVTNQYKEKTKPTGRVYLFTGLLKCGVCGGSCSGIRGSRKASYYLCATTRQRIGKCTNTKGIRREYFDEFVLNYIEQNFLTVENIKKYAQYIVSNINNEDRDVHSTMVELHKNIKKLENRMKKLKTLYLDDEISDAEYKETKNDINKSKELYESELYKLTITSNKVQEEDIVEYLMKIKKNFKKQDPNFLKVLLHKIINTIVIYEDSISIYLNVFNPYPDDAGINIDLDLSNVTDGLPLFTLGKSKVYRLDSGVVVSHFSFDRDIFTYQYKVQNQKKK